MKSSSSFGSSSKRSNYSRGFELPEDSTARISNECIIGGAMLPIFLNDLRKNTKQDLVEVTLELENDSVVVCNVTPTSNHGGGDENSDPVGFTHSITSRIRRKFPWLRSPSLLRSYSDNDESIAQTGNDLRRNRKILDRSTSSAQRALTGLRFISKKTGTTEESEVWRKVELRFERLAKDGYLSREDFGECIGMVDSKEFALGIFDALARRRRQKLNKISKDELYDFWSQISDQSFDARLQIFFDMVDHNGDGRITREEIQDLLILSASANKLSKLKERAEEYASLIMEEMDMDGTDEIEIWQLETLLLQRETYMNYSRPLSTPTIGWSRNISNSKTKNVVQRLCSRIKCLILENWQRGWILLVWILVMAGLFTWKFIAYRKHPAFPIMGYCLTSAKGAAETLKLNMALILLPVCRNTLTWLRTTRARFFIPFDDNINFHKMIAFAIVIGIILHAGNHLICDFPRLIKSSPQEFAAVASDFNNVKPTYKIILTSVEGVTGIVMVALMAIAFTLATRRFRRNDVKLPPPLSKFTGFNAFWYSHHLLALVYVLLLVHGTFLYFVHKWYQKTTWMYISVPLFLYIAERSLRTCRSENYSVRILKVSSLPGDVFTLTMSKPNGFKFKSGQYVFLQCPKISPFEWHPFSITSAPRDDHLCVHIRTVGDWTQEMKRVFIDDTGSSCIIGRAKFGQFLGNVDQIGLPRLLVDGPYGAPAQDYKNYDVLLLVGLGIGATPFISILKDLLITNTRAEDHTDLFTDASNTDDSMTSSGSSSMTINGKKRNPPHAHFIWVTREACSFEWFKGVMDEVAEMDHKGQIEMHNYLTSVYEEGDARSTLITMVQALSHAKHGVDILSGTRVRTHFARPNWNDVFKKIALKHPYATIGVFYCGTPMLAKELKKLSYELTCKTTTRFEFHKEHF
ncbi:respiratory burst oxidase homolog protein E-like [Impatiens glandulifera]|uniref:respiratory burst oxidase homolog protein E-like n=1 Tax=Impatiens glandulifera TaxID=253017 RepID=UPI001FB19D3B|nr:respiratory burst oxidase homolog protein E-like [Impatiens glandulifera]